LCTLQATGQPLESRGNRGPVSAHAAGLGFALVLTSSGASFAGLTSPNEALDAIDIAADGRLEISTGGCQRQRRERRGRGPADLHRIEPRRGDRGQLRAALRRQRCVGLTANDEDLDAACDTSAGSLLLSTLGSFNVTGASGADEDVLRFAPGSLGPTTSGSYGIFLDTSTEGIATSADVSAVEFKE
jgi:hypothetical protein